MHKFWCFADSSGERELFLEGAISDETWRGDEVTPAVFKAELFSGKGSITVWINSPGGDVFAASEIYTALKEYPGKVTVKVSALAASAASIVAMAGDEVLMSPVSYMVIHNPSTIAIGDSEEMRRAIATLDEVKEGIINAYEAKTGLPRSEISGMMSRETLSEREKGCGTGIRRRSSLRRRRCPGYKRSRIVLAVYCHELNLGKTAAETRSAGMGEHSGSAGMVIAAIKS